MRELDNLHGSNDDAPNAITGGDAAALAWLLRYVRRRQAMNFEKILSPIQLNDPNSLDALRLAQHLAAGSRSRIVLLHVVPNAMVKPDLPGYGDLFPKDEREVRRELVRLAGAHLSDGSYDIVVKSGDPAQVINSVAQELGVDLIVIGTHGRRGLSHLIMGSVAEKVMREAPCMVLTVRPQLAPRRDHLPVSA